MPKYRLLSSEELKALEKEFIEYLVVNGITADDWVSLKKNDLQKAENIIEFFSDVVFEGIMRKTNFLEHRGKSFLRVFQCLSDRMVLVAMETEDSQADFTNPEFIKKAMSQPPNGLKVFTLEKKYEAERGLEIFKMIQSGCVITDDRLFKALCMVLPEQPKF